MHTIGIAIFRPILLRSETPHVQSQLDGPQIAQVESLQFAASDAYNGFRPTSARAESRRVFFLTSSAIASILIAEHNKSRLRV